MKKNNIFIISNTSWNLYNFRKELILELSKHYDIYLVCPNDQFSKKLLNYNINIIDIDFKKSKFNATIIEPDISLEQIPKILIRKTK